MPFLDSDRTARNKLMAVNSRRKLAKENLVTGNTAARQLTDDTARQAKDGIQLVSHRRHSPSG